MAEKVESPARNFITHLRLPFQLLLAPFMLWGAVLIHGRLSWKFAAAFVILTVCFYGGTTAFNSHYDRDEGPIGGLEHPPPPGPWLLPGSLILQAVGLVLAWFINPPFAACCAVFAVLGILYSHPITRWKGKWWLSWLVVMLGQGALGALAGACAAGDEPQWTEAFVLGLAAAALIVGGLYPISQSYQVDEDVRRGDRTVAVVLGSRGVLGAAFILTLSGLSLMAGLLRLRLPLLQLGVPLTLAFAGAQMGQPRFTFRGVMAFQIIAGTGFTAFMLFLLLRH